MILTEPDSIIVEHLRAEVAELTRVGYSKFHTNTSESFNGTGSQDTFTLTKTKLLCINSVVVDSVTQKKYLDYNIDLDNNKIVFVTGSIPGSGTNNVVIDHDYNVDNKTWIYPDKPRTTLTKGQYPRIGIVLLSNPGEIMGLGESDTWHNGQIQIDIISYKGLKATISSETKEGQDICNYLGAQIKSKLFTKNAELANKMEILVLLENRPLPFEEGKNQFRRTQSYSFQGKNVGDPA